MNLYYLNHTVNAIAAKPNRTQSDQIRLAQLLQDAESSGCKIEIDRISKKYIITCGGRADG